MPRSFTGTSWCPRSSTRTPTRPGRRTCAQCPAARLGACLLLGERTGRPELHCYWQWPPLPRHWPGANTPTTSDPHRLRPALPPGRTRPGRRCPPGTRTLSPPKPAICWSSGPSSTTQRAGSCSADRAESATPAAEDSGSRAWSHGPASTRSRRPALGRRMRTCRSSSARQGGTLLERSIDCGSAAEALVDLVPGTVSAHLIRYGGVVPGPGTGAVAGVRISFDEPGQ